MKLRRVQLSAAKFMQSYWRFYKARTKAVASGIKKKAENEVNSAGVFGGYLVTSSHVETQT